MTGRYAFVYMASRKIKEYIARHRVDWRGKDAAKLGGLGDSCGVPPTPVIQEFLTLLSIKQGLFTQEEFVEHCFEQWKDWLAEKTDAQRYGLRMKLRRNFYSSMIDSFHVYAQLIETRKLDTCILDAYRDAIGKHDIVLTNKNAPSPVAIDLMIDSARSQRAYKDAHRPSQDSQEYKVFPILLPKSRPWEPGNKAWYCLRDFEQIFKYFENKDDLWGEWELSVIPCTCGYHTKRASA